MHPTKLIISADKTIAENVFIHADLTLPLSGMAGKNKMFVQDINLLNLAMRYETDRFGFYLPVSLNSRMNFWMGGAVRLGPLLLGVHNWSNIISKNKIQKGGAYAALIFRFGSKFKTQRGTGCNFGGIKDPSNSSKKIKQLNCPTGVQ